ncbi:MAG: M17 family peptidase N-terminal domain-containing protein [Thermodesulfobacteriota bacterium]
MEVIISSEPIDRQECQLVSAGLFEDERPLRGPAGLLDWRLNGAISREVINGRITGQFKETVIIPSSRWIQSPKILLIGLGSARRISYPKLREVSAYLLQTLLKIDVIDFCCSIPHSKPYPIECSKAVEVWVEGLADALNLSGKFREEMRMRITEEDRWVDEALLGAQTAKVILKKRMRIKIKQEARS